MTVDQFVAQNDGKGLDFDGWYGNQCVDLILYYMRDVTGPAAFSGNAKDWYYNYGGDLANKYDRIANNPNDPNQIPQKGDIVIFGGNQPGSGGFGHIDIFLSGNATSWVGFDQNWGGQFAHKVVHNYTYVIGWLRAKTQPTPQGGEPVIQNADNEWGRWRDLFIRIRGREPSRQEFINAAVGQTWLRAIEILVDGSSEADDAQHAQEIGQVAIRDNWPGQIAGLQTQLDSMNKTINELNQTVAAITTDTKATKQQLQDALSKVGALTGDLEVAHDKIKDLEIKPAEDTKLLDGFGEWVGKLLVRLKLKKG